MTQPPVRRIVLCADDYGIAPGVSAAIRDLVARGRINATSAMTVARALTQAEATALADLQMRAAGDDDQAFAASMSFACFGTG